MDFKNKIAEIITQTHRTPIEQAEEIIQLLTENDNYKQLLQSCVIESVCIDDVYDYQNCQLPKGSCDLCRW